MVSGLSTHTHEKNNAQRARSSSGRSLTGYETPAKTVDSHPVDSHPLDLRAPLTPTNLLALQRTIGNQAVQRLIAQTETTPFANSRSPIQRTVRRPSLVARSRGKSAQKNSPIKVQRKGTPQIQRAGRWEELKNYFNRERVPTRSRVGVEIGKPLGAITTGGLTTGVTEAASSAPAGIPAGIGALNFMSAVDSGLSIGSGYGRYSASQKEGDRAGMKLGKGKAKRGGMDMLGGMAGTAQGALNIATAAKYGSEGLMTADKLFTGANYLSTGLGTAGAALGIVGGSLTATQGLWKTGKAAKKLWNLGHSDMMLSAEGERWRARVKDREQKKAAFNSLKTIGGALGIAGGSLVLASNPVGWALGIASAAIVGGLAAYKFYTKYKKTKRKQAATKTLQETMNQQDSEIFQVEDPVGPDLSEVESQSQSGEENTNEGGGEGQSLKDADPSQLDAGKRKQAVELADQIAQQSSKSAAVAGEMRSALPYRHTPDFANMQELVERKLLTLGQIKALKPGYLIQKTSRMAYDALVLLKVLNISEEEADSSSGQELIENKLSVSSSI